MVWRLGHTGYNIYSVYDNWTRHAYQLVAGTTLRGVIRWVEYADGYQKAGIWERVHIVANHADCTVSVSQLNHVAGCLSVAHRIISQRGWFLK